MAKSDLFSLVCERAVRDRRCRPLPYQVSFLSSSTCSKPGSGVRWLSGSSRYDLRLTTSSGTKRARPRSACLAVPVTGGRAGVGRVLSSVAAGHPGGTRSALDRFRETSIVDRRVRGDVPLTLCLAASVCSLIFLMNPRLGLVVLVPAAPGSWLLMAVRGHLGARCCPTVTAH